MAIAAFELLIVCIFLSFSWRRVPLMALVPGIIAAVLAVVGLPGAIEWPLLAVVAVGLVLTALLARRRAIAAYLAEDPDSLSRYGRLGALITGMPQWATFVDIGVWGATAKANLVAARPILERAAKRRCPSQVHAELLLESVYGNADVAELVEDRWQESPRIVRPVLLQLAIATLVDDGRSSAALTRLGRSEPAELTDTVRPLVLADIAAAIGDRETLEAILARRGPFLHDVPRAEIHRARAEHATGNVEAGNRRLRSLDVPPAGRAAGAIIRLLAAPAPAFDGSELDHLARRGLDRYRELAPARSEAGPDDQEPPPAHGLTRAHIPPEGARKPKVAWLRSVTRSQPPPP